MIKPIAINVNLSTSGRHLGGAAIASEFHSSFMAEYFPVQLWRMWDNDEETTIGKLVIKNFISKTNFGWMDSKLPRRLRSCFLDSDILKQLLYLKPDIVHLHNPIPSFAFERIAREVSRNGSKVVATTHGFFEVMYPNYNLKPYEKWLWKRSITDPIVRSLSHLDALLTLYPDERKLLIDRGVPESKIHLIPNGVNPFFLEQPQQTDFSAVREKFNLTDNHPIILFIGNHTANKGLDTVMRVASQLSQPATIVIGGKLSSPDEPQQWQSMLPYNPLVKIVFTDYLSISEQRTLYYLAELLLFPSLADTLPLTIIEAMACGLPVIAYGVGGIGYQLANDSGVVVEKGHFSEFLQAVEALLLNHSYRHLIAKNARLRQQDIFSWDAAAQETIGIYKKLTTLV